MPDDRMVSVRLDLLERFVDPDDCWFDHHGNCQAHDCILDPGEMCPNEQLRRIVDNATAS